MQVSTMKICMTLAKTLFLQEAEAEGIQLLMEAHVEEVLEDHQLVEEKTQIFKEVEEDSIKQEAEVDSIKQEAEEDLIKQEVVGEVEEHSTKIKILKLQHLEVEETFSEEISESHLLTLRAVRTLKKMVSQKLWRKSSPNQSISVATMYTSTLLISRETSPRQILPRRSLFSSISFSTSSKNLSRSKMKKRFRKFPSR